MISKSKKQKTRYLHHMDNCIILQVMCIIINITLVCYNIFQVVFKWHRRSLEVVASYWISVTDVSLMLSSTTSWMISVQRLELKCSRKASCSCFLLGTTENQSQKWWADCDKLLFQVEAVLKSHDHLEFCGFSCYLFFFWSRVQEGTFTGLIPDCPAHSPGFLTDASFLD